MSLSTSCILSPRLPSDGTRISVMSRHTLNDGKTPDERIVFGTHFDEWIRELAVPPKIVGSYYRNEIDWKEYVELYNLHLKTPDIQELIKWLVERALHENITLLCIEETPEYCHRRLLAEECQRIEENIVISLK